jgi:hypothetical protein
MTRKTLILNQTIEFELLDCPTCFVAVAAPIDYIANRRKDGRTFYCLNGHHLSWAETETDRLKKQVETAKASEQFWRERAEAEQRSHAGTKGELTKTKKRVTHGVCPCCNRQFQNVRRHMLTQHPGEVAAADGAGRG